jgi:hypothetical protein
MGLVIAELSLLDCALQMRAHVWETLLSVGLSPFPHTMQASASAAGSADFGRRGPHARTSAAPDRGPRPGPGLGSADPASSPPYAARRAEESGGTGGAGSGGGRAWSRDMPPMHAAPAQAGPACQAPPAWAPAEAWGPLDPDANTKRRRMESAAGLPPWGWPVHGRHALLPGPAYGAAAPDRPPLHNWAPGGWPDWNPYGGAAWGRQALLPSSALRPPDPAGPWQPDPWAPWARRPSSGERAGPPQRDWLPALPAARGPGWDWGSGAQQPTSWAHARAPPPAATERAWYVLRLPCVRASRQSPVRPCDGMTCRRGDLDMEPGCTAWQPPGG